MADGRRRARTDQQARPRMKIDAKTKVWVEHGGQFVMGDGGLHLLRAIVAHGSLTLAAREVGWSYRHAWDYIKRAERVLAVPLTRAVPGKGASRGTALTIYGVAIVDTLTELRDRIDGVVKNSGPTPQDVARRGRGVARRSMPSA